MGSSEEYSKISIKNNDNITLDIVYFYSEVEPEEAGNYWHYVDGMVTKW